MSLWGQAPAYDPRAFDYLTHEDIQHFATRYNWFVVKSHGVLVYREGFNGNLVLVPGNEIQERMDDPRVQKLAAALVKQRMKQ